MIFFQRMRDESSRAAGDDRFAQAVADVYAVAQAVTSAAVLAEKRELERVARERRQAPR